MRTAKQIAALKRAQSASAAKRRGTGKKKTSVRARIGKALASRPRGGAVAQAKRAKSGSDRSAAKIAKKSEADLKKFRAELSRVEKIKDKKKFDKEMARLKKKHGGAGSLARLKRGRYHG